MGSALRRRLWWSPGTRTGRRDDNVRSGMDDGGRDRGGAVGMLGLRWWELLHPSDLAEAAAHEPRDPLHGWHARARRHLPPDEPTGLPHAGRPQPHGAVLEAAQRRDRRGPPGVLHADEGEHEGDGPGIRRRLRAGLQQLPPHRQRCVHPPLGHSDRHPAFGRVLGRPVRRVRGDRGWDTGVALRSPGPRSAPRRRRATPAAGTSAPTSRPDREHRSSTVRGRIVTKVCRRTRPRSR